MSDTSSLISITLKDLMRWEYFVKVKEILPKRRVSSILAGRHSSKLRGRGLDFEEVRNYVPGDDIRNIDWKVTARTKKTHSKVFVEEKERPSITILDQSKGMFFGSQKYMKSVIAAEVAALHAFRTIKMGDRFGGWIFNDVDIDHITPHRSKKNIQRFLKLVEKYNNALVDYTGKLQENSRLNEVLLRVSKSVTHDYVIGVISDFEQMNQETLKILSRLSKHNDVVLIQISDPFEDELPKHKFLLSDGELQLSYQKKEATSNDKFEQWAKGNREELVDFAKKYRMVHINFSTDLPLAEQVKNVFGNKKD